MITNIIIITSLIDCSRSRSAFTKQERLEQTKYTIQTIKEKIPNVFIVLIDCSSLSYEEKKYFKSDHYSLYA